MLGFLVATSISAWIQQDLRKAVSWRRVSHHSSCSCGSRYDSTAPSEASDIHPRPHNTNSAMWKRPKGICSSCSSDGSSVVASAAGISWRSRGSSALSLIMPFNQAAFDRDVDRWTVLRWFDCDRLVDCVKSINCCCNSILKSPNSFSVRGFCITKTKYKILNLKWDLILH